MKYVLVGALMLGFSAPAMAQQDNKAVVESIAKVIKSNAADADAQVKDVYKKNKKNPEVLVGIARAVRLSCRRWTRRFVRAIRTTSRLLHRLSRKRCRQSPQRSSMPSSRWVRPEVMSISWTMPVAFPTSAPH